MRRIGSNIRKKNSEERSHRLVKNIIEYSDTEAPKNQYPRRIVSPTRASSSSSSSSRVLGAARCSTWAVRGNLPDRFPHPLLTRPCTHLRGTAPQPSAAPERATPAAPLPRLGAASYPSPARRLSSTHDVCRTARAHVAAGPPLRERRRGGKRERAAEATPTTAVPPRARAPLHAARRGTAAAAAAARAPARADAHRQRPLLPPHPSRKGSARCCEGDGDCSSAEVCSAGHCVVPHPIPHPIAPAPPGMCKDTLDFFWS